jgi:hypothetical protein
MRPWLDRLHRLRLCARYERPCYRAGNHGYELAPSHGCGPFTMEPARLHINYYPSRDRKRACDQSCRSRFGGTFHTPSNRT